MSQALGVTVDGTLYKVGIEYKSMKRTFEIKEGSGKTSAISGKVKLDPIGLYYTYKMKFRSIPGQQADYDALFLKLSEPVYSHSISFPFAQTMISFDAMIESGSDTYKGFDYDEFNGQHTKLRQWDELEITFIPTNVVDSTTFNSLFSEEGAG
jgi:hypothetical protein